MGVFLWKFGHFGFVFPYLPPCFFILLTCWFFVLLHFPANACWACFSLKLPIFGLFFIFSCLFLQNNLASLLDCHSLSLSLYPCACAEQPRSAMLRHLQSRAQLHSDYEIKMSRRFATLPTLCSRWVVVQEVCSQKSVCVSCKKKLTKHLIALLIVRHVLNLGFSFTQVLINTSSSVDGEGTCIRSCWRRAEAQADNNVNGFPKLSEAKPPFRSFPKQSLVAPPKSWKEASCSGKR